MCGPDNFSSSSVAQRHQKVGHPCTVSLKVNLAPHRQFLRDLLLHPQSLLPMAMHLWRHQPHGAGLLRRPSKRGQVWEHLWGPQRCCPVGAGTEGRGGNNNLSVSRLESELSFNGLVILGSRAR